MPFRYDNLGHRVYFNDNTGRHELEWDRCNTYACHCNQYGSRHDRWNTERRCGYSRCPTCYIVPTIAYHTDYDRYLGETVFRTVKNPCADLDCTICHPGWSLTLVQLSEINQARIARDREAREYEERRLRQRARTERAQERAKELLFSLMTEEQKNDYISNGIFQVVGSDGNTYEFRHGYSGNIYVPHLDGRKCAHPYMTGHPLDPDDPDYETVFPMASEDAMAVQMLKIMTDADGFLGVAYNF